MINEKVIQEFKIKVNDNVDYMFQQFKNVKGKNKWNIICSCIDWISVAVNYLNCSKIKSNNIDLESMQLYLFISAIDIIYESVNQLHRVIFDVNTTPFDGQSDIWKNSVITRKATDDNQYFKDIRAAFGAHPVNLKGTNERLFASWPSQSITDKRYDWVVILSSNIPKKDNTIFRISFKDLICFLDRNYQYLLALMKTLDEQYSNFRLNYQKFEIECSDSKLKQLNILKHECETRISNSNYRYIIDKLIVIYSANMTDTRNTEAVLEYRNELSKVITELKTNLQNMQFSDLTTEFIVNPECDNGSIAYDLEKVLSNKSHPLFNYHLERIADFYNKYVYINHNMKYDEVILLIHTAQYFIAKNEKNNSPTLQ